MMTILQVEDDPNDIFFLQKALKKAEVPNPIQVAEDGQEAIDYLSGTGKFSDRQQFPMPSLVLLDLKLPHVMGLDVLKWIREVAGLTVVVIVMSASAEDADIATAYRLGANAFLTKPSESSKLDNMAVAIKHFWLMHNTLPQESYSRSFHGRNGNLSEIPKVEVPLATVNGARRSAWEKIIEKNI
jgi:CheY-like chemotaxis protein